ncbi:phage tail protein [Yersinia enterocolitica]|uniref:phage tail protein n=1 Tax=Yersinia kristensenii TaxID=28152 RepID=UPI001C60FFB5|nr:phage tail protein [Yersinia kristensenii]MBW5826216.1 phage tail protein [Yersinia kristensenii]HDL7799930.1 phage tail protein [Yersinia enterocolitica]
MSLETFNWRTQGTPEGSFDLAVRKAQFGDGYTQIAADGLNSETQSWPLTFVGNEREMLPLLAFVRRHRTRSCLWAPPYGELGLWRVEADSIKVAPVGGKVMSVSFTFTQAFSV